MSRHKTLADGMSALLAYRSRPEIAEPIVPVKTNWTVVPANDNAAPEELAELHTDQQREIIPSIAEIMREVEAGATVRGHDIETESGRRLPGPVVAIGKLRFSDGKQKERAYTYGPEGKLIRFDAPMPLGSMLHTRERLTRDRGPSQITHMTNGRLAAIMGVEHREHVPGKRMKRGGKSYSAIEAKAMLAAAYANTDTIPAVTICQPGLPSGSASASDGFIGMKKGKKGESGAIAWQDVSSMMAEREIWEETERALAYEDKKVLDAATTAKTMREIGIMNGFNGKRAERMGKQMLRASNDNLNEARRIAA